MLLILCAALVSAQNVKTADLSVEDDELVPATSLSFIGGLNRGMFRNNYYNYSNDYDWDSEKIVPQVGFIYGAALKLHIAKKYNLNIELSSSTERYDRPFSTKDLKASFLQLVVINEFKFSKSFSMQVGALYERKYTSPTSRLFDFDFDDEFNVHWGLCYTYESGMFLAARLKIGMSSLPWESYIIGADNWEYSNTNNIQFLVGYNIVVKEKNLKEKKEKKEKSKAQSNEPFYDVPAYEEAKPDYSDYTDGRLHELLQQALNKEEYDKAEYLQQELDKRENLKKHSNMSKVDLQKLIDEAVADENYEKASELQEIMDKKKE